MTRVNVFLSWALGLPAVLPGCSAGAAVEVASDEPTPVVVEREWPVLLDTSWEAVIFPADACGTLRWVRAEPIAGRWTPRRADIEAVEPGLGAALERVRADPGRADPWAVDHSGRRDFLRRELGLILEQLPHFRRQYVGIVDAEGRRRLYLNAFAGPVLTGADERFGGWRRDLVVVSDGGFWFWQAEIDVQTGEIVAFSCNGSA